MFSSDGRGFGGRKLLLYPRLECFFALIQTARCWGTKVSLSMRDNFPICPIDCDRERETIATLSIARNFDRGLNVYVTVAVIRRAAG